MILTPLNVPLKELMVTSSTSPRLKKKKDGHTCSTLNSCLLINLKICM